MKLAKGESSLLLDEYAAVLEQIEILTQRKEEIRDILNRKKPYRKKPFQAETKIQSKTGTVLTISTRRGAEIPPEVSQVKQVLEQKGRPELFEKVVQVAPKLLKHYLNDEEYNKLVLRKDNVLVWSISR